MAAMAKHPFRKACIYLANLYANMYEQHPQSSAHRLAKAQLQSACELMCRLSHFDTADAAESILYNAYRACGERPSADDELRRWYIGMAKYIESRMEKQRK